MAPGTVLPLTPETTAALAGEWDNLIAASPTATPFQSREWIETILQTGRGRAQLITVREGDDLIGLFPVRIVRGSWSVARSFGIGPSDYLHPLARGGREADVAREVAGMLRTLRTDLVDLHQLREGEAQTELGRGEEQARCLVIGLPDTFDAYKKTLGKSLRYDVNRAGKMEALSVETATTESLDRHVATFIELHRARWRSRGLPGAFGASAIRFQRVWTRRALESGWLRLATLTQEGEAIGSIYAMTLGETRYFYQAGMAPTAKSVSPGTVLVAHSIREAIEEGQRAFDMMRGAEPYKRRWMPTRELANLRVLSPRTPLGEVAMSVTRRVWRVESQLRERLEGGSLLPRKTKHGS